MITEEIIGMTKRGTQYHVGAHTFYTFSKCRGFQWLMDTVFWSGMNIDYLIYIFTSSSLWWSHQWKNSPWMDFLCEAPQHCSLGTFCKAQFIGFARWWPTCVTEESRMASSFLCSDQSPRAHIRTWDISDATSVLTVFDQEGFSVSNLYQAWELDWPCSNKHREAPLPLKMCAVH